MRSEPELVCEPEASHWHSKIPVEPRTEAAERRMPLTRQPSVALGSAKYRPGSAIICRRSFGGKCVSCSANEDSESAVMLSCKPVDLHFETSLVYHAASYCSHSACITAQRD